MQGEERLPTALNWLRAGILLTIALLFAPDLLKFGFIFIAIGIATLPEAVKDRHMLAMTAIFALFVRNEDTLFYTVAGNFVEFIVVIALLRAITYLAEQQNLQQSQQKVRDKIIYWFAAAYIATAFALNFPEEPLNGLGFIAIFCKIVGFMLLFNNLSLFYRIVKEQNKKTSSTVQ